MSTPDSVVFVPPAGAHPDVWSDVLEHLSPAYPTMLWDRHAGTSGPIDDLALLADRLIADIDAAGLVAPVGVGISMGAMVLQYAAIRHPGRFGALVLGNTNHRQRPAGRAAMLARAAQSEQYSSEYLDDLLARWFSKDFLDRSPGRVEQVRNCLTAVPASGHSADWRAIAGLDTTPLLTQIECPTVVVASTGDVSTPPSTQEEIAAAIPGAELVVIADAGHMSCVERPDVWARCIRELTDANQTRPVQMPDRDEENI